MLMRTVPIAHKPVQARIAEGHSLGVGEPPSAGERGIGTQASSSLLAGAVLTPP